MSGTQPNNGGQEQFLETQMPIGLPWRLSLFAVALFALSLFAFVGLRFGYRSYLEGQVKNADAELENLAAQVSADEQDKFIALYSQILNLKGVLENHQFTANTFGLLEKNVVSGVVFTAAEFKGKDHTLQLSGMTPVFETLAAQMAVFEKSPEVKTVALEKVNLASGSVNFTLNLIFKPDAFVQQTL